MTKCDKEIKPHYLARNKDGWLAVFRYKPVRKAKEWWEPSGSFGVRNDHPLGEGLTWEDEPRPVYLSLHSPEEVQALVEAVGLLSSCGHVEGKLTCPICLEELRLVLKPFINQT